MLLCQCEWLAPVDLVLPAGLVGAHGSVDHIDEVRLRMRLAPRAPLAGSWRAMSYRAAGLKHVCTIAAVYRTLLRRRLPPR